ncbi:MAG: DUF1684 domain-containing protein [Ignavibacteria bacterium]|nr:DUF1684 domain-containing protein [Ignavibacteria bacterium]
MPISSLTERDSYFVPFTDRTNGETTYKAGRYLDIKVLDNDSAYVIDFNMAYNPYCAYDNNYSCPIVPKRTISPLRSRQGEEVTFQARPYQHSLSLWPSQ